MDNKYNAKLDEMLKDDYDIEVLLKAITKIIEKEKANQTHALVISCLDDCIDYLNQASMAYYVSTK